MSLPFVIEPLISTVNFTHSHRLNHCQFCEFLSELKGEYPDLLYPTAIWQVRNDKIFCNLLSSCHGGNFSEWEQVTALTLGHSYWHWIALKISFCCRLDNFCNEFNPRL